MFLKEGQAYNFCTQEDRDGSKIFTGSFLGYERVGDIRYVKILSCSTARVFLINPSNMVWIEYVNLDLEDFRDEVFDVVVKEKYDGT